MRAGNRSFSPRFFRVMALPSPLLVWNADRAERGPADMCGQRAGRTPPHGTNQRQIDIAGPSECAGRLVGGLLARKRIKILNIMC